MRLVDVLGIQILDPLVRMAAGENPRKEARRLALLAGAPLLAFLIFLGLWSLAASQIHTKYGTVPTPVDVWTQAGVLMDAHWASKAKREAFAQEQQAKATTLDKKAADAQEEAAKSENPALRESLMAKADALARNAETARNARYSGAPTYVDQILTSLKTVFTGFLLASLVALPLGIACGLSKTVMLALNPLIQIFRPVSPLAWLPIVMIVVGALYTTDPEHAWFEKSFLSSAITVALCSLWPTLVNTALGVSSVDRDHLNVARVLRLGWWTRVTKIVVPSALPWIFSGLRISLSVGWMVLIAAEMLAQNPGLGKFVWDMFQNGSSETLAQIMVAVFTIGSIEFFLDRSMIVLQRFVNYGQPVAA